MKINIIPNRGIEFEKFQVKLGDNLGQIIEILGEPYEKKNHSLYYYKKELRIDLDQDGKAEYIEFTGGFESSLEPIIFGKNAFTSPAKEIYDLLKKENNGRIDDSDSGYSYEFLNLGIVVVRDQTEEDIQELLYELKECGIDPKKDKDFQYEKQLAEHWSGVAVTQRV